MCLAAVGGADVDRSGGPEPSRRLLSGSARRHLSSEVAHLLRVKQRYPELAADIQRLIALAGEQQCLQARRRPWRPSEPPESVRPRTSWKANMGITIVQKSDLTVRKRNPRIALVLAGGAI